MNKSIIIKKAETKQELEQILELQNKNHVLNLSIKDRELNGFVTVKHNIELLTKMNSSAQQIIAKENDVVVGYALVMLKEFTELIPVLVPMFEMFKNLSYNQKQLSDYKFYVMGQICIAETHRGQGIFEGLYSKHKEIYSADFEICLTEVSANNIRSMKAHKNLGFQTIYNFKDETDDWNILLWNWVSNRHFS
ncbi:MAG: GNAT family N-acetyltransferase [Sphingobacteriia bacterium]|nr:MAG: GNAT family N-acetyltransferase [Sphingobacteriia bacterium]